MLSFEEFERLSAEALEHIPEKFREKMKNVALLVEDEPDEETRKEEGLAEHETLLGLYRGIPNTARGSEYGIGPTLPDTITLYRFPIEEEARETGTPVSKVIEETLWHEVAHYFGYDEDGVKKREEERNGTGDSRKTTVQE